MKADSSRISRAAFLQLSSAFALSGCRSLFTGAAEDFDESMTILFSDAHVSGSEPEYAYAREKLADFVTGVLRRRPLPRQVVFFGDLARYFGKREDYAAAVELLKPLANAGIRLAMGLGNHDRYALFSEFFPDAAASSPVPGCVVSDVHLRDCDLLMLDSLDRKTEGNAGDGSLTESEQDWLAAELPRRKRPLLIGAHHPLEELSLHGRPLSELLIRQPAFRGFVCGHVHRWSSGWFSSPEWGKPKPIWRKVSLPSVGYWGDIGWAEMVTTPMRAEIALKINDFYCVRPCVGPFAEVPRPQEWRNIVEEKRGARCLINLRNVAT